MELRYVTLVQWPEMHLIYRSLYIAVDICTRGCNHIDAQDPSPTWVAAD